jgi:hypothetical protein
VGRLPAESTDIREDFGMVASAPSARTKRQQVVHSTPSVESAPLLSYSVGVRTKFGDDLEGIDLLPDGIVFRSPIPLQPGKTLELILCRGSILVDAIVVHCGRLKDDPGGFAIHTRYHHVSEALCSLIREEVARLTDRPDLIAP